ncbi:M48 family metallopeptidase [Labilibacter marinus]|uniref:M48 family metallopeptidase n=1 Tax=Labilibacter marinus TaxID=1477105 RepID=UPI00082A8BEB|nr:M48 family metallopeptidase [Labilibacter marinus]
MNESISYQVHPKEIFYFVIKLIFSLFVYTFPFFIWKTGIAEVNQAVIIIIGYLLVIMLLLMIRMGLIVGYLRGNAVKITEAQFPDIYHIIKSQSGKLGLKKVPDVYLLQAGGLLNAFAARFMGRNYVVLYADIMEEAYENNLESVEFVIAHELGHIKRKHMQKDIWLFPALFVPFLSQAYSRACEYTCDNIGAVLCPKGAVTGLVLLASGKKLYPKVDVSAFIQQKETDGGFWTWFAEKVSTHPRLIRRIARLVTEEMVALKAFSTPQPVIKEEMLTTEEKPQEDVKMEDYSKYLPK